jgi:hypothetical protein
MMTIEFWNIILGLLMTVITGFIVKKGWATSVKALIAIGVSVVFATAQGLIFKEFTLATIMPNLFKIFAIGEAMYGLYFKNLFAQIRGE